MNYFVEQSRAIVCVFALLVTTASSSTCAEVGIKFTGQVTVSTGSPYDVPLPIGTILSGHLVFESNTFVYEIPPTGCSDCAAYRHKHINGLRVEFPGLTLQADEYIIQIKNDVNVSGVGTSDILGIWFPEQSLPAGPHLEKSLLINGTPVAAGAFRMELVAPSTTFSNAQLPTNLDPSVFIPLAGSGTFGDGFPNPAFFDVFFKPQSVSTFPHSTSDHDLDGDVDGADFLIWQRHVNMDIADGDADSSLLVDEADLALWQGSYGFPLGDIVGIAVPEPGTLIFLISACGACLVRR